METWIEFDVARTMRSGGILYWYRCTKRNERGVAMRHWSSVHGYSLVTPAL